MPKCTKVRKRLLELQQDVAECGSLWKRARLAVDELKRMVLDPDARPFNDAEAEAAAELNEKLAGLYGDVDTKELGDDLALVRFELMLKVGGDGKEYLETSGFRWDCGMWRMTEKMPAGFKLAYGVRRQSGDSGWQGILQVFSGGGCMMADIHFGSRLLSDLMHRMFNGAVTLKEVFGVQMSPPE